MARTIRSRKERLTQLNKEFSDALASLIVQWANCDTWLVSILELLFRIDERRAHLIYASFTSSRARAELADRAAIMCLQHPRDVRHLQKLLKEFKATTRTRNRFAHASYHVGFNGMLITSFTSWEFSGSHFDGTNAFDHRELDGNIINEIRQADRKAGRLCARFRRFAATKPAVVLKLPRDTPLPLPKIRKKR
jgi:hypothetical protein